MRTVQVVLAMGALSLGACGGGSSAKKCGNQSACGGAQACVQGTCRDLCVSTNDCGTGFVCVQEVCLPESGLPGDTNSGGDAMGGDGTGGGDASGGDSAGGGDTNAGGDAMSGGDQGPPPIPGLRLKGGLVPAGGQMTGGSFTLQGRITKGVSGQEMSGGTYKLKLSQPVVRE